MQIKVMRQILEWNEDVSNKVRSLLQEKNVYMINVMGSPGAGKTTFIVNLIKYLRNFLYRTMTVTIIFLVLAILSKSSKTYKRSWRKRCRFNSIPRIIYTRISI